MRSNRIKRWTAWLLAAAMLCVLPVPTTLASSAADAETALKNTFGYYQTLQNGILSGWEDLAAAYVANETLTEYSLPRTNTGTRSTSVLVALMKGDAAGASVFASALVEDLRKASYAYGDALELIAIEAYNRSAAAFPGAYQWIDYDRNAAIACLLATTEEGGGFGFGSGGDPDMTGLALAALAPFRGTDSTVQAAVTDALAYLHGAQQSNGGFASALSGNNANSAAVVIWGLCALGENLAGAWSKNGNTPIDALLSFQTAQGGFGVTDKSANDPYATPQAALALALAQVKSGKTFFTDLTANAASHKSLSLGVVDARGACHERAVTVKDGDTLSIAIARALRAQDASRTDYRCHAENGLLSTDDLSGFADGAKILALHKGFENVAYFKTGPSDGLGVNAAEAAFGSPVTLTLVCTSAGAVSAAAPLAGIGVDGNGDGFADGTTDANGTVTLSFIEAGAHSAIALPGYYDESNNYAYVRLIAADTAILPARITMKGGSAQTAAVSVRVEGVSENILFKPSLTVGNDGDKILTVLDAVKDALDAEKIDYVESGGYISSIDGVTAGAGGDDNDGKGYDGWVYTIAADEYLKGEKTLSGMAAQPIASGDEIVVYYGNYNYTTLFPSTDVKLNADRSVTVTVRAWQTDWNNLKTALSPIPDVRVSWAENTASAFTGRTDADGTLVIPASHAPVGRHTLQIDKAGRFGLPDVVRLAPGYTVNISREGASASVPENAANEVYIKVTGPSGTLFARKGFDWYRGVTPLALLAKTDLRYETDAAGEYVKAIGGIAEFHYGPNSGWLYRVNGIETIKESAAKYKLNAGDDLEWFYTRDYTQEAGSSAWSSAPAAESAAAVTLRPEAETVNGAAAVRLNDEDVKKAVADALRDKADEIAITPHVTDDARKISATLSAASVRGIANETDAKLTLKTALGDVSLSAKGIAALKEEDLPLTLSIERDADRVSALVALDDKAVEHLEGGVKLRVPVLEKPTAGTVALLVREDGTEEIVLLSMPEADALVAILDGSASIRIADRSLVFADVSENAWFKEDADFVSARGLFRGTDALAFSGDAPMTRAMLASVFHRLAGSPAAAGNAFADVADTAWYREAAKWAADSGVIRGMDDGFAGNKDITREQLAAMAMRFAQTVDVAMGDPADLAAFTDRSAVSAWANDAVRWAVGAELIEGDALKRLNAGGAATRAEVAAVMRRFVENLVRFS
jgi:hypothetical protein